MEVSGDHPRLLLHNFISTELCKELEFIHRSSAAAGYRYGVLSTALTHLVATNCAHLLLPVLPIRDKIKEMIEEKFDCHFELFPEFTALISWCKGSSIGWHSDDNKEYLKQRNFAAVCYLNSHGKDFDGGIFHFKHGKPSSVVPVAGDVLIYTADSRNIHSVDEVTDGERLTLTLWFTRDSSHDEDAKLIRLLSRNQPGFIVHGLSSYVPSPASDNMYQFPNDELGCDIRCARLNVLGFHFCLLDDEKVDATVSSSDPVQLLSKPLRICRENEIYKEEFANSLHALQVIQFYCWKAAEFAYPRRGDKNHLDSSKSSLLEKSNHGVFIFPCNNQFSNIIFGRSVPRISEISFNWDELELSVKRWEEYTSTLCKNLCAAMPHWISQQAISFVEPSALEVVDI